MKGDILSVGRNNASVCGRSPTLTLKNGEDVLIFKDLNYSWVFYKRQTTLLYLRCFVLFLM